MITRVVLVGKIKRGREVATEYGLRVCELEHGIEQIRLTIERTA